MSQTLDGKQEKGQSEVPWSRKQMEKALAHHQANRLTEAEEYYRQVLRLDPKEADANNLLGVLLFQTKRAAEGLQYLALATQLRPDQGMFFYNYAIALKAVGKIDEAMAEFQKCLEKDPKHYDSLNSLSTLYIKRKKLNAALGLLNRMAAIKQDDASVYKRMGEVLQAGKDHQQAAKVLHRACELAPNDAAIFHQLGLCLQAQEKSDEAITAYRKCLELKPELGAAHNNLAIVLADKGDSEQAVLHYQEALKHNPKLFQTRCNLGGLLRKMGELEKSIECLAEAVDLKPDCAEAWCNLGNSHGDNGRLDIAMHCYHQSLSCKPDYAQARLNRSLALLRSESFDDGWLEYEWRSKLKECPRRHTSKPRWTGKIEAGKRLLLHVEQGLGDTFQMVRYAKRLHEQGMHIILEAQKPLKEFLDINGVASEIYRMGEKLPDFELQVPLMSLPGILWPTEGFCIDEPYLKPADDRVHKWQERVAALGPGRKIGIAWQGNPAFKQDTFRSIPLAKLQPLVAQDGLQFISLQKLHGADQLEQFPLKDKIHVFDDLDEEGGAFMDTAALMTQLDCVVCSDSAVAHLAGALGVETHVTLPFAADWRWLAERLDCPWYPTMSLYRQSERHGWDGVVQQVVEARMKRLS